MASIEYRPTQAGQPRWRVVWRENGAKQGQTWATEKEALAFKGRVEAYGNQWPPGEHPQGLSRDVSTVTFDEWARQAIAARSRATDRTKADYLRDLDRHFQLLRDIPLAALDSARVVAWLEDRRAAGLSDKTVRNLNGFASSLLADALGQHPPLVTHNPFLNRLSKSAPVRTEEMVFLTPQEFRFVHGYVREQYQPLIELLFGTGLRYGEATALTVGDVELFEDRKTLTVTKAWKRTGPSSWVVGEPKTPKSRRTIAVSPALIDLLAPLVTAKHSTELLFPGKDGGRLPHIEVYKRGWAPAVARARVCDSHYEPQRDGRGQRPLRPKPCDCPGVLGKTPRLHDLRHSHASTLIAQGVPMAVVSRRLGHSSIQITLDRYSHLDHSIDQAVNEAVERALAKV